MMSGSKAPDFDAYGLFRATHSHVSAPLRSVLDMWVMTNKEAAELKIGGEVLCYVY